MKTKKILLITLLLLFLTGCRAEYNLNIDDDIVTEDINIYVDDNDNEEVDSLNYYLDEDIAAFNDKDKVYNYKTSAIDSGINLTFKYGDLPSYSVSSFFQQCFEKSSVSSDDENIYIKASEFVCQSYNYVYVTDAIINFSTSHEVVSHNADKEENGIYTWYPLSNNKDITLILKKITNDLEDSKGSYENNNITNTLTNQNESENNTTSIILVILVVLAFVSIVGLLFMYKIKRSQRD